MTYDIYFTFSRVRILKKNLCLNLKKTSCKYLCFIKHDQSIFCFFEAFKIFKNTDVYSLSLKYFTYIYMGYNLLLNLILEFFFSITRINSLFLKILDFQRVSSELQFYSSIICHSFLRKSIPHKL